MSCNSSENSDAFVVEIDLSSIAEFKTDFTPIVVYYYILS